MPLLFKLKTKIFFIQIDSYKQFESSNEHITKKKLPPVRKVVLLRRADKKLNSGIIPHTRVGVATSNKNAITQG